MPSPRPKTSLPAAAGNPLRSDSGPSASVAAMGIILEHEILPCERDDGVITITFRRSPDFNVFAASHIPFLPHREPPPGAIGSTGDACPVAFEHDGFIVRFPSSYQLVP